jgi:hypothetical protein
MGSICPTDTKGIAFLSNARSAMSIGIIFTTMSNNV